jgi:hypothetical protein
MDRMTGWDQRKTEEKISHARPLGEASPLWGGEATEKTDQKKNFGM